MVAGGTPLRVLPGSSCGPVSISGGLLIWRTGKSRSRGLTWMKVLTCWSPTMICLRTTLGKISVSRCGPRRLRDVLRSLQVWPPRPALTGLQPCPFCTPYAVARNACCRQSSWAGWTHAREGSSASWPGIPNVFSAPSGAPPLWRLCLTCFSSALAMIAMTY